MARRRWPAPTNAGGRRRTSAAACGSTSLAEAPDGRRRMGPDEPTRGSCASRLADGANWRAVAGMLLWSDGRYALVRDGADVVLIDFLPR
jgi:hypothetical protein